MFYSLSCCAQLLIIVVFFVHVEVCYVDCGGRSGVATEEAAALGGGELEVVGDGGEAGGAAEEGVVSA